MGREKASRKLPYPGGFFALPSMIMESPKFHRLPGSAVKLLIELASQYNGKNNGDLTVAWKILRKRGWKSEDTLNRAKQQLLNSGFIAETRKGRRPNLCSLYGITWIPINPSPKHDILPYAFPRDAWRDANDLPPIRLKKNIALTTNGEVNKTA